MNDYETSSRPECEWIAMHRYPGKTSNRKVTHSGYNSGSGPTMGLLAAKRVLEMKTVRSLLQAKGHAVWSITPDASVYEALKLMADKNVGALLVLEDGELVGIISERDYARKVALRAKTSHNTFVQDIMTPGVISVHPDQTVEECMALMTDKHIRHLPVVADGRLMGVISIGDVVKSIITEQGFMIEQLTSYIVGRQ